MENRPKLPICGIIWLHFFVLIGGLSCHSQRPEVTAGDARGDQKSASEQIAEADQLYAERGDLSRVRSGIALLRQARVAEDNSYEAAWKLAEFSYYLGAHTKDEREKENAYREGTDAGKIAVQLQNDKPEGHFWLGANYGGAAENSVVAGLANIEDIRAEMEAVLRVDESFQAGSAYLVLGQLYLQAPRFLGGDNQKAVSYLEKGLRFGSNNALLRLRLAEAYHAINRDAETRKQIDFLMKMTPEQNYVPEHKEAVEKAQQLLEKMK
jgi:hypothetical protein